MATLPNLDPSSDSPIYRQLFEHLRARIECGALARGERLPPTRDLANQLNLNRTTVSAAYALLEREGLLVGHVGRGSFVAGESLVISFATSRPAESLFPMNAFRTTCQEVIASESLPEILQLGSPGGYAPLRRYLLDAARAEGVARAGDDVLITSGCQQAFDLIHRALIAPAGTVLVEDPVYPGLRTALQSPGVRVIGVPVGPDGIIMEELDAALTRYRPSAVVVTSSFQNPTGATMPVPARMETVKLIQRAGALLIENDIYGQLGASETHPTCKALDESGGTVLLRSFSKIAFPGLRVGWVLGPAGLIRRLTECKQSTDLHSDQLSQAILLRFAESGRLEEHRRKVLAASRLRLQTALTACEEFLPSGSEWTRPTGGMNLWVRLPEPLDSAELLDRAERERVSYLPGKYFAAGKPDTRSLRISFAGLAPEQIRSGLATLGRIFNEELKRARRPGLRESAVAMV